MVARVALPPASTPAIEWMAFVDRIAVLANRATIATVDKALQRVMTGRAEGPQRPEDEGVVIATVRWVMIGYRRPSDAPLLLAEDTQRLNPKLMRAAVLPKLSPIPDATRL